MKTNWIALAVSLTLSAGISGAFAANTYSDVNKSWAQKDINKAVSQDIMTGYNDGMFHPEAWVSREDFVQMTAKTIGLAPDQASIVPSFNSVAQNSSGFGPVDNQAWISSYPTGVAQPENPVRRVEALSALAGALNKPLVSDAEATTILSKYQDAALVPVESRRAVATAIQYKLFAIDPKSVSNSIEPLRPATRAEVASMLEDLYVNRDIAIVQNGKLVANAVPNSASVSGAQQTTTNTTASQTTNNGTMANQTTTGTSAVSGSSDTGTSTTGTAGANTGTSTTTTTTAATSTTEAAQQVAKVGYEHSPYRNSANTISELNSVNTTTTPSTLDATVPVTLAPGTTFMGTVAKSLYSDFNRPGDPAMLILDHPVMDANGRVIAPAGSKVVGFVNSIVSHNESTQNAQIGLTFNGIITPNGQVIPINATVDNVDGILKAGEAQGIVFKPDRSIQALRREISTSEGGYYGSTAGKAAVLDQPPVSQVSSIPVDPMDITTKDLLIGVGDRIQVRLDSAGPGTIVNNTIKGAKQQQQQEQTTPQPQTPQQ